jgi:hypothetical protein
MRASRGMGDINPSKMPGAKKKARKDGADFEQFAKGGKLGKASANPVTLGQSPKLSTKLKGLGK